MKKRAKKTKASTKARRAAKPSTARSAAKTTSASRTSGAGSYTPAPLKTDGWPPFRYPIQ